MHTLAKPNPKKYLEAMFIEHGIFERKTSLGHLGIALLKSCSFLSLFSGFQLFTHASRARRAKSSVDNFATYYSHYFTLKINLFSFLLGLYSICSN